MFKFIRNKFKEIIKKVSEKEIKKEDIDNVFEEIELTLLQANVSLEVVEKIKEKLKEELEGKIIKKKDVKKEIINAIKESIKNTILEADINEFFSKIKSKKPCTIMFVGTNGSGKTTTIAKIAYLLKNKGLSVVFAACDTFRAASIEQLETHGRNLGVKVVKHAYGSDAAAVAYDAIEHAKARSIDVVLIDTAGRTHANINLMKELEKIKRVVNPDITIFVGDSLTGNDFVRQCKEFQKVVNFDYIILTKTDVDEKAGAILSASITNVPILFIGTGQNYGDLEEFKKENFLDKLF